jgi:hypothetical protein
MHRLIQILLPVAAATLAACSSIATNVDYDESVDFSGLQSYAWIEPPNDSENGSPLVYRRVVNTVNAALKSRGFAVNASSPDFQVAAHLASQSEVKVVDWGYRHYGGYGAWGARDVSVHHYDTGSLVIDIVATETNQVVWRGTATKTINPDASPGEITETVSKAVQMILDQFPPK